MSSPITVSVTPENGFSGTVQVTLAGMPSGIISNPASPFSVAAGQNAAVVFGAAINATTTILRDRTGHEWDTFAFLRTFPQHPGGFRAKPSTQQLCSQRFRASA